MAWEQQSEHKVNAEKQNQQCKGNNNEGHQAAGKPFFKGGSRHHQEVRARLFVGNLAIGLDREHQARYHYGYNCSHYPVDRVVWNPSSGHYEAYD